MGNKLVSFTFKTGENEQIETTVKLPKEPRSVIHGIVKDNQDKLVKDAVVKLFELPNLSKPCHLVALTHTFTDECGQFLFGPLEPNKHYVIKVWVDRVNIRNLPVCTKHYEDYEENPCDEDLYGDVSLDE